MRGGAETLLVGVLRELANEYYLVLVTLSAGNEFEEEEIVCDERYSIGYQGNRSFLPAVLGLRKIIQKVKPDFIHAHLVISSQIARLANGRRFPFIYSLHSILSLNVFNKSWKYRLLEKILFNKRDFVIAVSDEVLADYVTVIGKPKKTFVITNFVSRKFIENSKSFTQQKKEGLLKMVAVGNYKKVKNYELALHAIMNIEPKKVTLDIYGGGEKRYKNSLQKIIDDNNLPVQLKEQSKNIQDLLPQYDVMIMCSNTEGFGMAAVEGMAVGLPLILSDIPVLRSVTHQNAFFFDPKDPNSLTGIINDVLYNDPDLKLLSDRGKEIVKQNYTKEMHLEKLLQVYKLRIATQVETQGELGL